MALTVVHAEASHPTKRAHHTMTQEHLIMIRLTKVKQLLPLVICHIHLSMAMVYRVAMFESWKSDVLYSYYWTIGSFRFTRQKASHSGQSTHFKGWGFEILKNCKRVGVHIFPLKRVDWYKGWKQTIRGGVLQTSKLCTYIYKTKLKK